MTRTTGASCFEKCSNKKIFKDHNRSVSLTSIRLLNDVRQCLVTIGDNIIARARENRIDNDHSLYSIRKTTTDHDLFAFSIVAYAAAYAKEREASLLVINNRSKREKGGKCSRFL